jgi:hypothetical protein
MTLVIQILAGPRGLLTAFRVMRLPDPPPLSAAEVMAVG